MSSKKVVHEMEKTIYSDEYKLFLRLLHKIRKDAKLTQQEVASRLGRRATQSFISKCERGERRLDIVETRAFCRVIGVPYNEFILRLESELEAIEKKQ